MHVRVRILHRELFWQRKERHRPCVPSTDKPSQRVILYSCRLSSIEQRHISEKEVQQPLLPEKVLRILTHKSPFLHVRSMRRMTMGGTKSAFLRLFFWGAVGTIMMTTTTTLLGVQGFIVQPPSVAYRRLPIAPQSTRTVRLHNSFNVFGAFGNFLNSNNHRFQQQKQQQPIAAAAAKNTTSSTSGSTHYHNNDDDEHTTTATPAGTYRLVSLPVRTIKTGGLRLFLLLYLLGQQQYNPTTDTAVWKAEDHDQPIEYDDASIDFWYLPDRSALLSITLTPTQITIDRVGSDHPSTAYVIQEAAIVEGVLRELEQCAVGQEDEHHRGTTDDRHRLVTFADATLLATVRAELAFG